MYEVVMASEQNDTFSEESEVVSLTSYTNITLCKLLHFVIVD